MNIKKSHPAANLNYDTACMARSHIRNLVILTQASKGFLGRQSPEGLLEGIQGKEQSRFLMGLHLRAYFRMTIKYVLLTLEVGLVEGAGVPQ